MKTYIIKIPHLNPHSIKIEKRFKHQDIVNTTLYMQKFICYYPWWRKLFRLRRILKPLD